MSHQVISSILRHDAKQTSYKIALLRALNDVVLSFPDVGDGGDVAVPLRALAEAWVAYYWPFVDAAAPVLQGRTGVRAGVERADVAFRAPLTALRAAWEAIYGPSGAAGGWLLVEHLRVPRKAAEYPTALRTQFERTLTAIAHVLEMPIRHAGPGEWSIFAKPMRRAAVAHLATLPGVRGQERVVVVPGALWEAFRDVSLWVEALCIHEWSLFTERVDDRAPRGVAYALLTQRPDNRLSVDWERNRIDVLLSEGTPLACPWTGRPVAIGAYQIDHVVPVSVLPFHELWNLVPADPRFNMHEKRARLPGPDALAAALPRLAAVYRAYGASPDLGAALRADVALRFARTASDPPAVARAVGGLVESIAMARNLPRF